MKTANDLDNRSTVGGPSRQEGTPANEFTAKLAEAQKLAAAMPYNVNKALEHGEVSAFPEKGQTVEPSDPSGTGSTLTETIASEKAGAGEPGPYSCSSATFAALPRQCL
jgi:catalase